MISIKSYDSYPCIYEYMIVKYLYYKERIYMRVRTCIRECIRIVNVLDLIWYYNSL
mgnify:CR=1 FL=1